MESKYHRWHKIDQTAEMTRKPVFLLNQTFVPLAFIVRCFIGLVGESEKLVANLAKYGVFSCFLVLLLCLVG